MLRLDGGSSGKQWFSVFQKQLTENYNESPFRGNLRNPAALVTQGGQGNGADWIDPFVAQDAYLVFTKNCSAQPMEWSALHPSQVSMVPIHRSQKEEKLGW